MLYDHIGAIGKARAEVIRCAGYMFRVVIDTRENAGSRIGSHPVEDLEQGSCLITQAGRLVIARAEPEIIGMALARPDKQVIVAISQGGRSPRSFHWIYPGDHEITQDKLGWNTLHLVGEIYPHARGHTPLQFMGGIFHSEQVFPLIQAFFPFVVDDGRRTEPDGISSILYQFLHQVKQALVWQGFKNGYECGIFPVLDPQLPFIIDGCQLQQLFRGDVVAVPILGHPGTEAFLHGYQVHGVQDQHIHIPVHVSGDHINGPGPGSSSKGIIHGCLPDPHSLWHAPEGRIGIGNAVQYAQGCGHGGSVVVPVIPTQFGEVIPRGFQVFAPFEVIITGRGGLLDRVSPYKIGGVLILVCLNVKIPHVPEIYRGAFGPG